MDLEGLITVNRRYPYSPKFSSPPLRGGRIWRGYPTDIKRFFYGNLAIIFNLATDPLTIQEKRFLARWRSL